MSCAVCAAKRGKSFMRKSLKAFILSTTCALECVSFAYATDFNVPAGDLKAALDAYSQQTGAPLLYPSIEVTGVHTNGARGALTPEGALSSILANTGFSVRRESGAAVIV